MLLVVDIGNTNTVAGLYDGSNLLEHWRITSDRKTADELGMTVQGLLRFRGYDPKVVDGAIICSVVPPLNSIWTSALNDYFDVTPHQVGIESDLGFAVDMDMPQEVGADRLVNAVAGIAKYGYPLVIVDLGTAITLDVVSPRKTYIGGAIAPGLVVAMESLFARTAKLPQIALEAPPCAVGRNTIQAIQSGLIYGFTGLVDTLVELIFEEIAQPCPVVATGGHAHIIADLSKHVNYQEPWLTLEGLRILHERAQGRE